MDVTLRRMLFSPNILLRLDLTSHLLLMDGKYHSPILVTYVTQLENI